MVYNERSLGGCRRTADRKFFPTSNKCDNNGKLWKLSLGQE